MKTNTKQSLIALFTASAMAIPFALAAGEPSNVADIEASSKDATSLNVTWSEALDSEQNSVDHYRIYYGTASVQSGDADSYEIEVDTVDSSTSYVLSDLITDTAYYLSVTGIDTNGNESLEYGIEASGTPTATVDAGDTVSPTVLNVIAADKTHVLVGFSEAIKLPELLAEAAFSVSEQINPANTLEVLSATNYGEDPTGKTVVLETSAQTKNVNYIVTASVAITDLAGNPIESGNTDSGLFLGSDLDTSIVNEGETTNEAEEVSTDEIAGETSAEDLLNETPTTEEDTTAPEDITNLVLDFKEQLEKFVVIMNWTASLNTAKDIVDQMVYMSADRGITYDNGQTLGPVANSHEVANLEGGKEYTFKLTTKDAAGNESVGVVKSIRLPQTGLGAGFLLFGSVAAAGRVLRRRRKNEETF